MTYLEKHAWQTPSDYFGFNPVGDFCVLSQHRDSDALTRSNFTEGMALLSKAAGQEIVPYGDADEREAVYYWEASHWAVGWVQYLMIRVDAPEAVKAEAERILSAIADYPALNEDAWSALEWQEASDYWERSSVRDRVDMIKHSGCSASIFAARRPWIPDDDCGALFQYLIAV